MRECSNTFQKIQQAGNYTYKAKMQTNVHTNTQTIVHDTYENSMQNAKQQKQEIMHNLFGNFSIVKCMNDTGQKPNSEKKY